MTVHGDRNSLFLLSELWDFPAHLLLLWSRAYCN